ncbi:hypothetical protein [Lentzea guizhouensis]|nr:hypothetical protein [Lentzea guizhouensis]
MTLAELPEEFPEQIDEEGLEAHSVRWYIVPALTAVATHGVDVSGEAMEVEHAVLFKAHDLQAPFEV